MHAHKPLNIYPGVPKFSVITGFPITEDFQRSSQDGPKMT